MKPDLILTDATIVSPGAAPIARGWLAISGDKIVDLGPMATLPAYDGRIESLAGRLLTPGFVNIHTHAILSLMRGIAIDMGFAPAYTRGVPHGHEIGPEDSVALARLGALEALLAGSTAMVDSYVHGELTLPAMCDLGMRVWACGRLHDVDFSRVHLSDWEHKDEIGKLRLGELEKLTRDFNGAFGGRARTIAIPHAPDTCSADLLRRAGEFARANGLKVSTHLSQSKLENAQIQKRDGCTPTQLLERVGLLNEDLIAAHCIHMTEDDVKRFGAAGATVAHVPKGNATGGAVAHTPNLSAAGAKIALGTDNLTQDMAEQMRWGLANARVHLGRVAEDWQPEDAFEMATSNGAKALGVDAWLGRLAPGYAADIVAWDFRRAHLTPLLDPLGTLVHDANGRDVQHVWVAGRQVVRDGEALFADTNAVRVDAQKAAEGLWARAAEDA
ncbi:MAG: amidohydrolase family protein [Alphaproteobacteria bacterium]|nr:amidohydrolase family protein [Alphaproteobacteria bacterium]